MRACLSWAYDERLIDCHPLRLMRGPGRAGPRRELTGDEVHALLAAAEHRLVEAHANHATTADSADGPGAAVVHRAEQDLLLVRLAADTGARRGELAALHVAGLTGRVLRIERAVSAGQLTTPKSGHGRTLTLGTDTAALWHQLRATWTDRLQSMASDHATTRRGPWLFASEFAHHRRLGAEVLGHRFAHIREVAEVPDATLHRLRHTVATLLVADGKVLQAQARLGHADAATTLREYSHALPATDELVADAISTHLDRTAGSQPFGAAIQYPNWLGR